MILQYLFYVYLSDTSPQVKKRDPLYIEGAESWNDLQHSYKRSEYDGEAGVQVIPCAYQRQYIEWTDRGKGTVVLLSIFILQTVIYCQKQLVMINEKIDLSNGNYIEDTAKIIIVLVRGKSRNYLGTVLIAMKSTQRKKSKRWNSLMLGLKLKGANGFSLRRPIHTFTYLKTIS